MGDLKAPVLYSFRRCPYAIRARLAIVAAGKSVALREIKLSNKPQAFLLVSPSKTVPALDLGDHVLDESLDIMEWALAEQPKNLYAMKTDHHDILITQNDGPFKFHLDRAKYANRYPGEDPLPHYSAACDILFNLEADLMSGRINAARFNFTQFAILPFVRQFAFIDRSRFEALDLPQVKKWLNRFLESQIFERVMKKYDFWQANGLNPPFPDQDAT